jgi:hypothetical protein
MYIFIWGYIYMYIYIYIYIIWGVGLFSGLSSIFFHFFFQLCVSQLGLAPASVGYYVGLFTGIYSVANFCTSWLIGHLSDLYGKTDADGCRRMLTYADVC